MGAEPYFYFVPYKKEVDAALQELRRREFEAGRYNPVMSFLPFPIGPHSPAPGAQHTSIEEAWEASEADGTRSILDLDHVADEADFRAVAPLDPEFVKKLYGTTEPTREMIEHNMDFFEDMERGQGIYVVIYKNGRPNELFIAGYSFD